MSASVWISQIKLISGIEINLEQNSIIVFVGPNNSGKSLILDELDRHIHRQISLPFRIVESVELKAKGTVDEFKETISHRMVDGQYRTIRERMNVSSDQIVRCWTNLLSGDIKENYYLAGFYTNSLTTLNRLNLVEPAGNLDFINELRTHPIHTIKEESHLELLFSKYFKIAFGEDVIVNHGAGNNIPLHIGNPPPITIENDRVSASYQKELRSLPQLHKQGDGMKSFAGVFLSLLAEKYFINLLDEPEAFLHPPQASLLAKMIAQNIGEGKQLFTSTHSEHFLKGLLDVASERLVIVRMERNTTVNNINILGNDEIREFSNESFLRHSNVLDGLFHKRVILVESDSDARFFSAIVNGIIKDGKMRSPDLLFVPTGGKHRFPIVIRALNRLSVPFKVVGDFDLYNNENPVKLMVEALDGDWSLLEADFKKIKKSIDEKRPELETAELKQEIEKIFTSFNDRIIPENKINDIKAALKRSSPWAQAKETGKAYLPSGEALIAFKKVQEYLARLNIHILEIGELESFDREFNEHGPKWVSRVLERDILNAPELEEARKFVKSKILSDYVSL